MADGIRTQNIPIPFVAFHGTLSSVISSFLKFFKNQLNEIENIIEKAPQNHERRNAGQPTYLELACGNAGLTRIFVRILCDT